MDLRSFSNGKKIVLYGYGEQGRKFYIHYGKDIDIAFIIDSDINKKVDVPIYRLQDVSDLLVDKAIIVTVGWKNYLQIRTLLIELDLLEDKNFIYYEKLVRERKIAYIYGNCHMSILSDFLKSNSEFKRHYDLFYYNVNDDGYSIMESIEKCDLLITQDVRENNNLKIPSAKMLRDKIKNDSVFISVPNLYRCNLFFPQIDVEKKDIVKILGNDIFQALGELDIYILSCFLSRISIDKVEEFIKYRDVFSNEQIVALYKNGIIKLKERERYCTIKISDYIQNNYQNKQLFYNPDHPTNDVIYEKGKRILDVLGILCENTESVSRNLDAHEVFIYGCVKEVLNIKYDQKYINKVCSQNLRNSPLNLREYIEECYSVFQYLEWKRQIRNLLD